MEKAQKMYDKIVAQVFFESFVIYFMVIGVISYFKDWIVVYNKISMWEHWMEWESSSDG